MSADGLILNYTHGYPAQLPDLIRRYRIPCVWLNANEPFDCVHSDDDFAGYFACLELLNAGHRNIAWAHYGMGTKEKRLAVHYSVIDRYAGYSRAMREAGLKPRRIDNPREISTDESLAFSRAWLDSPDRPSAVLVYDPGVAYSIMYAASTLGLSIPRDLSIVTLDRGNLANLSPRVSSMSINFAAVANAVVPMLIDKIREPATPQKTVVVPPLWMKNGHTFAPPHGRKSA